jgi:subtilase family serine protease
LPRRTRRAAALAAVTAVAAIAGAGSAGAHPVVSSRSAPHRYLRTDAPPTTADCQSAFHISCYSPNQFQTAYDLRPLYGRGQTGRGQTIAIVDSFGSPTIAQDLHQFDSDFGLPDAPSLKVIAPAGAPPAFDPADDDMFGWAFETTLDVEYAHAIAPGANILLVETPVSETEGEQGFPEIVKAENYVVDHHLANVISQSFGATEETFKSTRSLLSLRSANENAARHGVTMLAASGDTGSTDYMLDGETVYRHQVNSWPSSDPLVTSVGGTQLHLDAAGNRIAPDNVWNDIPVGIDAAAGGGPSHVFGRPWYQYAVRTGSGPARATPDISMTAAVDGGALVYLSFAGADQAGYYVVGGTSEATPIFAGVVAIADQMAARPLGQLNPRMYLRSRGRDSGIVDVTRGDNTFTQLGADGVPEFTVPGFAATPGYDMASGLGTVDAAAFTRALARR